MIAMDFSPRDRGLLEPVSRSDTSNPIRPSTELKRHYRDAGHFPPPHPWVETHGYHQKPLRGWELQRRLRRCQMTWPPIHSNK